MSPKYNRTDHTGGNYAHTRAIHAPEAFEMVGNMSAVCYLRSPMGGWSAKAWPEGALDYDVMTAPRYASPHPIAFSLGTVYLHPGDGRCELKVTIQAQAVMSRGWTWGALTGNTVSVCLGLRYEDGSYSAPREEDDWIKDLWPINTVVTNELTTSTQGKSGWANILLWVRSEVLPLGKAPRAIVATDSFGYQGQDNFIVLPDGEPLPPLHWQVTHFGREWVFMPVYVTETTKEPGDIDPEGDGSDVITETYDPSFYGMAVHYPAGRPDGRRDMAGTVPVDDQITPPSHVDFHPQGVLETYSCNWRVVPQTPPSSYPGMAAFASGSPVSEPSMIFMGEETDRLLNKRMRLVTPTIKLNREMPGAPFSFAPIIQFGTKGILHHHMNRVWGPGEYESIIGGIINVPSGAISSNYGLEIFVLYYAHWRQGSRLERNPTNIHFQLSTYSPSGGSWDLDSAETFSIPMRYHEGRDHQLGYQLEIMYANKQTHPAPLSPVLGGMISTGVLGRPRNITEDDFRFLDSFTIPVPSVDLGCYVDLQWLKNDLNKDDGLDLLIIDAGIRQTPIDREVS